MPIRAVIVDIGGVLCHTPPTGWAGAWERRLGLAPGTIGARLGDVWHAGELGAIGEAEVERAVQERLQLDPAQAAAFWGDLWAEYLGTLNADLAGYFCSLRPQYRTAIISNSFVGARARERQRYQFDTICEFILYSHELGIAKPDRRIFALACERLALPPAEIIYLDDVERHVAAARALGMAAVRFESAAQAIAAIEALLRPA